MRTFVKIDKIQSCLKRILCLAALYIIAQCAYAADNGKILEIQGDRYVIHVDMMNPDSEMTLLDVLHTCPEFFSINGKTIDLNYQLRIDNTIILADNESFLSNVKACEIDRIQICSNTTVAKAVAGIKGVIDIYYRKDRKNDGKITLAADTRSIGRVYADITNRTEKLAIQGYGMLRNAYGKAYPTDIKKLTDRQLTENLHLNLDWNITDQDRLIVKAFQLYNNEKHELSAPSLAASHPFYNRQFGLEIYYTHTFRNNAILLSEIGTYNAGNSYDHNKTTDRYPYAFIELNTPFFTPDLWLMIGTETDYENIHYTNKRREQYLVTDFYAQLDFNHGPWVLTLGDRFRIMNFWNRQYNSADQTLWNHSRTNHCYLISAGLHVGSSFFQTQFARRFFIPIISDLLVGETQPTTALRYDAAGYRTVLAHQGVLRYTFQHQNFLLHSSLENTWVSHAPTPDYLQLGFRNSVYWKTSRLELTLGANFYHQHINASPTTPTENSNYVTLKLAPTLNLPLGFRLSSVLLYSSRRAIDDLQPHLFATVKLNKQFGKRLNVFAEFHDLDGYIEGTWQQLSDLYQNRAVTIGTTFYPFRK